MRRISWLAALTASATLALAGGTAAAKPKDAGLGDRIEMRFHKNAKLRTIDGLGWAFVKLDYRCAFAPNLGVAVADVSINQPLPQGGFTGGEGVVGPDLRCTNRWRSATVRGTTTGWWGEGPPFRKGPAYVGVTLVLTDFTAVERFGQAGANVVLR